MNDVADQPGSSGDGAGFALDVVGIGALNLDYIATNSPSARPAAGRRLTEVIQRLLAEAGNPVELGTEALVDAATINAAIEAVSSTRPDTTLGGSAFNAIYAIARTQAGLRLGYLGVAGRVPVIGLSSVQQFEALGIDHRFVFREDHRLSGICFSFAEDGERTLLTHAGANDSLADHLARDFDAVVDYLARTRLIHVTSFLDDRSPQLLFQLLTAVKRANPATAICLDPGHVWSVSVTREIDGLVGLSDYLLVNYREFRALGGHTDGDSDEVLAARLVDRMTAGSGVVVVKLPAGVWAYRRERGKLLGDFYAQTPLPKAEIADDTGAGDVFAAGLLTVLTSDRLQIELGSLLGMRLARHKLRYVGSAGHAQFADVARDFIGSAAGERRSAGLPRGVFIAHGAHPEWLAVQRFIADRFELPVYSFESGAWGGRSVTDALADYLERCSFAVCVLTAEDFTGDGRRLARQNVIHEVGLFQGRHGFDRVAVLAEEGCDFVPPAALPYTITFPRHGISDTFYQLAELIDAQGVVDRDDG
ncbi:PfkB family carbohydrate kinase [Plantactinospora sp. GCM10030261]|uniref:PfkB family carbohydrate kinase n=1 Tax=Plantactinospora sp. GCM10030261 TaxID=3273420 RepID=UPI00360FC8A3